VVHGCIVLLEGGKNRLPYMLNRFGLSACIEKMFVGFTWSTVVERYEGQPTLVLGLCDSMEELLKFFC
jgi:hypothetical protein